MECFVHYPPFPILNIGAVSCDYILLFCSFPLWVAPLCKLFFFQAILLYLGRWTDSMAGGEKKKLNLKNWNNSPIPFNSVVS